MIGKLIESLCVTTIAGIITYSGGNLLMDYVWPGEALSTWWTCATCVAIFLKDLYYA